MRNVMNLMRSLAVALLLWGGAVEARAQERPSPATQDEYVPLSELPDSEKLPAAPFLIGAYSVAWVAVIGYVWLLWRRLDRVERDLKDVRRVAGAR